MRTVLTGMGRLPDPQRDALATAVGLEDGTAPGGFLVGLALLGLLAFAARRLLAEPVGVVSAVRGLGDEHGFTGMPEMAVRGAGGGRPRALFESAMPGRLDPAGARPDRRRGAWQPAGVARVAAWPAAGRAGR